MGLVKRTYVDGETVITADNLNDIQDEIIQNASDISTKGTYSKPSGGIPASDLASGVQTSLGKADTAYQKPSGGIPSTDLASAVQTSLGKADTALQSSDIDNTLTVTGKAADAKKTGDEISGIKNTLDHTKNVLNKTNTIVGLPAPIIISSANIDSSGVIISSTIYDIACFKIPSGRLLNLVCDGLTSLLYGWYGSNPQIGSTAVDNTRHFVEANSLTNEQTPLSAGYILVRYEKGYDPYQIDISANYDSGLYNLTNENAYWIGYLKQDAKVPYDNVIQSTYLNASGYFAGSQDYNMFVFKVEPASAINIYCGADQYISFGYYENKPSITSVTYNGLRTVVDGPVRKGEIIPIEVNWMAIRASIGTIPYIEKVSDKKNLIKNAIPGHNKFDAKSAVLNQMCSPNTGNLVENSDYFRSEFIDISGFENSGFISAGWWKSYTINVCYFNEDKEWIANSAQNLTYFYSAKAENNMQAYEGGALVIPEGAKYLIVSTYKPLLNLLQLADENDYTPYQDFGYVTKAPLIDKQINTEIHVDKQGGGDFTKITDAFNYITAIGGYEAKGFTVFIHEGTYDVIEELGTITDNSRGLSHPNGVSVIGYGSKENVIISMNAENATTTQKINMSPYNCRGVSGLVKNLTIVGQNCRYAVHQDGQQREDYDLVFEDVVLKYLGNDIESDWAGGVYGAGSYSGANITLRNCDLLFIDDNVLYDSGVFGMHTNVNFNNPSHIKLENCRFYGSKPSKMYIMFNSLGSGVENMAEMIGCSSNVPIRLGLKNTQDFDWTITGFGNTSMPLVNGTGETQIIKFSDEVTMVKNADNAAIPLGTPVKYSAFGTVVPLGQNDNVSSMIGIAEEAISSGDKGHIKTTGYVLTSAVQWATPSDLGKIIGDYLYINCK